ncbi:MAG: hypothetical protein JSV19_12685 [Phycisphaerales bacterium]|nr:MAG: hypothetical protein JSV19_12685 [Phycisphaerales bacterium]
MRIYTGHRYTIEDAVGNVLAEFLSEPEFQARFPLVFDDLREALADDGTWAGTDYGQDRALCFPKPGVEIQGIETKTDAVRPAPSTSP